LQASLKNTQLNDEIAKLRTKLYSSAEEHVDLSLIVNLLSQATKYAKSTSNDTELKNLYD
jgi:cell division protein FtsL